MHTRREKKQTEVLTNTGMSASVLTRLYSHSTGSLSTMVHPQSTNKKDCLKQMSDEKAKIGDTCYLNRPTFFVGDSRRQGQIRLLKVDDDGRTAKADETIKGVVLTAHRRACARRAADDALAPNADEFTDALQRDAQQPEEALRVLAVAGHDAVTALH